MIRRLRFLLFLLPSVASAFLVLQLDLQQMTELAERVFVGRCISATEGVDRNGRPVVYVSYEVTETLKGARPVGTPAERITFKQIRMTTTTSVSELPHYEVGEESIVFLSGESDIGLTAPVGLMQGKFRVVTDSAGEKKVLNGHGNRGLLQGLKKNKTVKLMALSKKESRLISSGSTDIPYDDFVSLVKRFTNGASPP